MSAWKYKRTTPAALVARHQLIRQKDLVDLVGKPTSQILSALAKTPYQKEIAELPAQKLNSLSLELALLKSFARVVNEIAQSSPGDIEALLTQVMKKFDVDSLKTILRVKSAGVEVDRAKKYLTPFGELDADRCATILENSANVRDVVKLLSDSEYGPALEDELTEYEKSGELFLLEVAIDRHLYSGIWKAARKLRGLDGKIARTILGLEIDSLNTRVLLRSKKMDINHDQTTRHLLPLSDVLGQKELEAGVQIEGIESTIEYLSNLAYANLARDYQYLLAELAEDYSAHKSLPRLENILEKGLLKTSLRMLKRYTPFFNIGLVLAFLNLKWCEVRNLRAIITGTEKRIPATRIEEALILPA